MDIVKKVFFFDSTFYLIRDDKSDRNTIKVFFFMHYERTY